MRHSPADRFIPAAAAEANCRCCPLPFQPANAPAAARALTACAADNLLTGALSDYTKADGGPLASVVFNVSRNLLSDSPLPASWHSSTLKVMDVSYNRVPGSLPAQWAAPVAGQRSAFPQLHTLMVQGNALEGAYPYGNGSAFASNFSITARPGNGMLEGAPAAAPAAGTSSSSSGGLSGGAIAGIVIGCVAAAGVWLLGMLVRDYKRWRCGCLLRTAAVCGACWARCVAHAQLTTYCMPHSTRLPAALVAVLAAYVLHRRRQRSVSSGAATTAADASAAGKLGWDKDVETGPGSNSPPGGSAWGSLGSAPPPSGEAASLRDSAMGSRATASSSPGGEGSGHGVGSVGGSGAREGSGATQLSEGAAGDTDVRRLPGGWATIDFSELELSTVLGEGDKRLQGGWQGRFSCRPKRCLWVVALHGRGARSACQRGCLICCPTQSHLCPAQSLLQARAALAVSAWPSGARPPVSSGVLVRGFAFTTHVPCVARRKCTIQTPIAWLKEQPCSAVKPHLNCPAAVAVKMLTLGSSQAGGAEEEEQQAKLLRQLEKEGAPGRLACLFAISRHSGVSCSGAFGI